MTTVKFDAEKFTRMNDFGLWRIKMKALLVQQGLAEVIKGEDEFKKAVPAEKQDEMKEKAHNAIIICLPDKVLWEVSKEETATGIWTKLESLYMTKTFASRLYAKQRLYSYKINEENGVMDQFDEFNKLIDDLDNMDIKIDDEDKAIILLNSLPKSFEHLKDVMLYGRDGTVTLEKVQNALRFKELQRQVESKAEVQAGESLNVKTKQQKGGKFKKFSQDFKKSRNQKDKESGEKETRRCHFCTKQGHLKKDCYAYKKKQAQKNPKPDATEIIEKCEGAEVLNVIDTITGNDWILDSGCSFHMCPHKQWFMDLKHERLGSVLLGNDQVCSVEGIGSIKLKLHDGSCKILSEVTYIPQLKRNLVSLGMLESKGYCFKFENGVMYVIKGSTIVMKGIRNHSLYYLDVVAVFGETEVNVQHDINIWHKRLGHVGEKRL